MASDTQTKVGGRSTLQDRCGRHTAHRSPKFSCAGRKGLYGLGICPRRRQQPIPFSLIGRAHYPSATPQRSLMAARSHGQGFVLGPSGIGGRNDDVGA